MQTPGSNSTIKKIQSRLIQDEEMLWHSPYLLACHIGKAVRGGSLMKDRR
ncbi:mCG147796 [Mus musculus]|nr:mCG147796 [Mus musculus]